jgi:hypothetical protein
MERQNGFVFTRICPETRWIPVRSGMQAYDELRPNQFGHHDIGIITCNCLPWILSFITQHHYFVKTWPKLGSCLYDSIGHVAAKPNMKLTTITDGRQIKSNHKTNPNHAHKCGSMTFKANSWWPNWRQRRLVWLNGTRSRCDSSCRNAHNSVNLVQIGANCQWLDPFVPHRFKSDSISVLNLCLSQKARLQIYELVGRIGFASESSSCWFDSISEQSWQARSKAYVKLNTASFDFIEAQLKTETVLLELLGRFDTFFILVVTIVAKPAPIQPSWTLIVLNELRIKPSCLPIAPTSWRQHVTITVFVSIANEQVVWNKQRCEQLR